MIPFAGAAEILHCLVRVGLCLCATTTCWGVGSAWGDGLLVPGWGWGCGCFIAGAEQKVESGGGDGEICETATWSGSQKEYLALKYIGEGWGMLQHPQNLN